MTTSKGGTLKQSSRINYTAFDLLDCYTCRYGGIRIATVLY